MSQSEIVLFEEKQVRKIWFKEEWHFSVVDVVNVLVVSQTKDISGYWRTMKKRLKAEWSEVVSFCHGLKLPASDGKYYKTDCANTRNILRIIQSIPSPKAEPLKQWLAKVGYERMQEIENPELAQERMKQLYEQKWYPKERIDKRLRWIAVRQELTEERKERGVSSQTDYAILTNEIMHAAFNMTVEEYKDHKWLKRHNLRDHMTDLELILTMLWEATTTKLHQDRDSKIFKQLKKDAQDGWSVAGRTRKDIEQQSGKKVISEKNYLKGMSKKNITMNNGKGDDESIDFDDFRKKYDI